MSIRNPRIPAVASKYHQESSIFIVEYDKAVHRSAFGTKVQVLQDMNLAFKVQTLQSAKFLPKTSIALKTFKIMCGVKMQ